MARQIRRYGPYLIMFAILVGITALLVPTPDPAEAATYVDPWWTNDSPSPECAACSGCGCPLPDEWSPERVGYRTGELNLPFFLFTTPGMVGSNSFSLLWRSYVNGETQMGKGMILSLEHSVERVVLNHSTPEANGGHEALWRRPDGLIVVFDWDGTDYSTSDCSITEALTRNGSGRYLLEDKWGNEKLFDANGMPDKYTDRNGNETNFTYNSSYQMTGLVDDRGKSYTIVHNTDGYMESIEDPSTRKWEFAYDTSGNLITIDTPNTTDQPTGITTTINYDGDNRVTGVEDGRGNEVTTYTWIASTRQIDKVTIALDDVDFTYVAGVTSRTDRNGNIHRIYHSGQEITSTDMLVGAATKYVTEYRYSGGILVTIVLPRDNRIDFTHDGNLNITARRHKTTDTASSGAADLLHEWAFTSNFVTSYTDPEGHETTYTRDTAGNVTVINYPNVTNPVSQTSVTKAVVYNAYGQATKITDEEGKVVQNAYFGVGDDFGLLEKVEVDPLGLDLETTYTYDDAWNVATVTDPLAKATTYTWDNLRRLKQVQAPSPVSRKIKNEYDANGNRTKNEVENLDKDGDSVTANPWITTTYTYTVQDLTLTIVGEIDASTTRTTTLAYDDNQNRIRVTKPEGNKDKWAFDERDLVASHIRGETSLVEATTSYAYDDNANLITVTDGRSNDTDHTFDLFDRRTKTTDPLGHHVALTMDENGRVTTEERKNSSDTVLARRDFHFDERGRLWRTSDLRKDPGTTYSDAVTQLERFKTGHMKTVTDARSKDTDYAYDNAWRRAKVTDAMGNWTAWTLDDNGRATSWEIKEIDGVSSVTHDFEATFDVLGRRLTSVEVDRTDGTNKLTTTNGYDSRGNLVWQLNAEGDPTRWTFDAAGRMTKKEVALTTGATIEDFTTAMVTEWGFDKNDRLDSHKDDAGNESTWDHDALDRADTMQYPDTKTVTTTFDDNGNPTEILDAAGNDIDSVFDSNNRMTSRTITRATGFLGTTSETYTYDGMGRLTKAEDNDYKVEFTHGVIGLSSQVYEEKQSYVGGTAYMKTVKKTYDAVGNKVAELYPSTLDLDYTWNDISRISTVTDGTNTVAAYSYYGHRVKDVQFESGATATYGYTGFRGEIDRIHHETSTPATIVDLQYDYNENNDRLHERYGGGSAVGDAFGYDKARRLTVAWMGSADVTAASSSVYVKKVEYVMDDDGNRSSVKVTPYGQSQATTSYTDNNLNQYTAVGGTSQAHDDNGSLTDDGTQQYEYDYKNQIVRVKQSSTVIAEYKYDALGRRVEKDDQTDVERYTYSGAETVSVYDGSNVWIRDFVFGQVIDEVLMLEQADLLDFDSDSNTTEKTRSFYHTNALGSVMSITDMNEAEVANYRYDPYGKVTITRNSTTQSGDPLGQPWAYTGRFSDEETGLYYYRARYYSPEMGRFLQRDRLGYADGSSLYQYVSSTPLVLVDPSGNHGGMFKGKAKHDAEQAEPEPARSSSSPGSPGSAGWDPTRGKIESFRQYVRSVKLRQPISYGECWALYGAAVKIGAHPMHPPMIHPTRDSYWRLRLHIKVLGIYIECLPPAGTPPRVPVRVPVTTPVRPPVRPPVTSPGGGGASGKHWPFRPRRTGPLDPLVPGLTEGLAKTREALGRAARRVGEALGRLGPIGPPPFLPLPGVRGWLRFW